jgi:hypothetical protein
MTQKSQTSAARKIAPRVTPDTNGNGRCVFGKIGEVGLKFAAYFTGEIDRKRPTTIAKYTLSTSRSAELT